MGTYLGRIMLFIRSTQLKFSKNLSEKMGLLFASEDFIPILFFGSGFSKRLIKDVTLLCTLGGNSNDSYEAEYDKIFE